MMSIATMCAGTVGHLATELVILQYQLSDDVAQRSAHAAEACGRALQKTNIVKDFAEDLTARHLLLARHVVAARRITRRWRCAAQRRNGRPWCWRMCWTNCARQPSMCWRCPTARRAIAAPRSCVSCRPIRRFYLAAQTPGDPFYARAPNQDFSSDDGSMSRRFAGDAV